VHQRKNGTLGITDLGCEAAVPKQHAAGVKGVKSFPLVSSASEKMDHFDIQKPSWKYVSQVRTYANYTYIPYTHVTLAIIVFFPTLLVLQFFSAKCLEMNQDNSSYYTKLVGNIH
jgi:hypothetical protein